MANDIGGLGFLLDRLSHSLGRDFEDTLSPWGLRATHLGVLSALTMPIDWSQTRLAAFLGVERQQMVNLLNELERRELVQRNPVPTDRRRYSVTLTEQGRQTHQAATAAGRDHESRVFGHLSEPDRTELHRLLWSLVPRGHFPDLMQLR